MHPHQENANLWSIILTDEHHQQLSSFAQRTFGQTKPKSFCTFVGTRSMFEHTLDRADQISAPERKVTVIAEEHSLAGWPEVSKQRSGQIIAQPRNRDSAAAVFLALAHVRAQDPNATVVICPSDHFIYPEDRFCKAVLSAARLAKELKYLIVLLGVQPDKPDTEYGWIRPGPNLGWADGYRVRAVEAFMEKPDLDVCKVAMATGGLWNTSILTASAAELWASGWLCCPDVMRLFEEYEKSIGSSQEKAQLKAIYEQMPSHNLSADILQYIPKQLAVVELTSVLWSDWGKSERIGETLRLLGNRAEPRKGQTASR